ncbi:histone-fold-containing protein, partial [Tirmania nivea]
MPRKSDPGPIPGAGPPPGDRDANGVSIDENVLPRSVVTRLAKGVLPQNTNIQKDAVLALTKGATVFINYLCTAANENAVKANKKTIMPKDILEAISQLELDEFCPRLQAELAKFEEITSEKRAAAKKTAAAKEAG